MAFLSNVPIEDPAKTYNHGIVMRNRRVRRFNSPRTNPSWLSPKLSSWSTSTESALRFLRGTFHSRFDVKDTCISMIEQLRSVGVAAIWVIREMVTSDQLERISATDLLKYLALQLLVLNPNIRSEKGMALSSARLNSATTEGDWFEILGSLLRDFAKDLYIFVDLELLGSALVAESPTRLSWPIKFLDLFRRLADQGCEAKVRVLLFNYGSPNPFAQEQIEGLSDVTVTVRDPPRNPRQKRILDRRQRAVGQRSRVYR